MSTDPTNSGQDYASQLLDLESQLRKTMSDASLRQDVFMAIRRLLQESRTGETDVRRLIKERFDTGQMRKETLLVVEKMLEHAVSDASEPVKDPGDTVVLAPDTKIADAMTSEDNGQFEQPLPGTVLRDRYFLQKQVSGGSMGVVFKALDRRLAEVESDEPWVAIKVLTPKLSRSGEALRAMQQEAAKGRCLTHANIVRFIDLDREGNTYFIVMEWIEGRSLAQILDDPDSQKPSEAQILAIARQLGEALEYAHQCGVVHADVKPANVMMKADGQVKLIDFGIARVRQQHRLKPGDSGPEVLGAATPAYSSMQVLTGEAPAPADDVFSLACLIYRMIAGYRVYGPRNAREAAEQGMSPQQPNGLADAPWKVLKKALSFARVARYSSPREFVNDLAAVWRDTQQDPVRAPRRDLDRLEPSKSRLPWLAAAVVSLGIGTVGVWQSGILDVPDSIIPSRSGSVAATPRSNESPARAEPAPVVEPVAAAEPATEAATPTGYEEAAGDRADDAEIAELDVAELLGPEPGPGAVETTAESPDSVPAEETGGSPDSFPDAGTPPSVAADTAVLPSAAQALPQPSVASVPPSADALPAADEVSPAATAESLPEPALGDATHRLVLANPISSAGSRLDLTLRENGPDAIIDLVRQDAGAELELIVEEVDFSGNRTELAARQYSLSNDGWVRFGAGQDVSQLGISMTPDPAREADLRAGLVIRNAETGEVVGALNVALEDDDQRAFEARIAPNTVGFAVSQVSVDEGQTAAQLDVLRYQPDDSRLEVEILVQEVTAMQNEDFFAPAAENVVFGPNERSARILVPLVQDSEVEGDEAFFIELIVPTARQDAEIFRRIAVMIRDDDS